MSKMRALLDQENWSEIDVPDEFQSIVNSLCSSESVTAEESGAATDDTVTSSNEPDADPLNSSQSIEQPDSNGTHVDRIPNTDSSRNSDVSTSSSHGNSANVKERGKSAFRMLYFRGVGYHMVNW